MKILYSPKFPKMLDRIPKTIQQFFYAQEDLLKENWQHPKLHIKKLKIKPVLYSFRITRTYRVIFYFKSSDEIVLTSIGHRSDIYD